MSKREKKIIKGSSSCPRLLVFRSHQHIYAQIIDDSLGKTLASCSTIEPFIKLQLESAATIEASLLVGETLGKRLIEKNIYSVVFDRNKKPYHGRIKAIADGARKAGVNF